jgi:hypothetical protein
VYDKLYGGERIPSTPTLPPPPTATIANAGQQTTVPNLVGRQKQDIEKLLADAGLKIAVKEERNDDKAPAGQILEQSPAPDTPTQRGDTVMVVLSKGPSVFNVVSVVGLPYDENVRKGLQTYSWTIQLDAQWDPTTPVGRIVSQVPPPGVPLTRGMPLTLVLSSGTLISLNVNLANMITLDSADLERETFRPGETIELKLHWKSRVPKIPAAYKVFVHLIGSNTPRPVAQADSEPQSGNAPTNAWAKDVPIADSYVLQIPHNLRGEYRLQVGMYPANTPTGRLTVVSPGKTIADQDSILIKKILIAP